MSQHSSPLLVSQSLSLEQSLGQEPEQIPVSGGSVEALPPLAPVPDPPPDPGLLPLLEHALDNATAAPNATNREKPLIPNPVFMCQPRK